MLTSLEGAAVKWVEVIENKFASSMVADGSTINFEASIVLPIEVTYALEPALIWLSEAVQVMFSTDPCASTTSRAVVASTVPPSQRNGEFSTYIPTSPDAFIG